MGSVVGEIEAALQVQFRPPGVVEAALTGAKQPFQLGYGGWLGLQLPAPYKDVELTVTHQCGRSPPGLRRCPFGIEGEMRGARTTYTFDRVLQHYPSFTRLA